jgi:ankyrin repeat protein
MNDSATPRSSAHRDYAEILRVLSSGRVADFEELAELVDGFPDGVDGFIGRQWITNAIDGGSIDALEWMIGRGVELRFRDDEGYTPLHSAIEHNRNDRLAVLELLLRGGADPDLRGVNGYTAAHLAAVRNDVPTLELLARYGADFSVRTVIDGDTTPLEEARYLGLLDAVAFLSSKLR